MKKRLLLSTASLLVLVGAQAQTQRVFNNAGGDNLWSNSANWSGSEIADTNGELAQLNGSPIVDQDYTVNRVQSFGSSISRTVSSSGGGVLTLNDSIGGNGYVIYNNMTNSGRSIEFTGSVRVNNTAAGAPISKMGFVNGTDTIISFGSTSTLDLLTTTEAETGSNRTINFNGSLTGTANLRIGADSGNITFGSTADNTGYAGDIVFFDNSEVISNTTVASGFLNTNRKIQVNGTGGSLTLNGAGAMGGNVVIGVDKSFTLNVNANQSNMGFLNMNNGSLLNIILDGSITELAFADSSGIGWGTGTVALSGFKENTVRFGTDGSGLTQAQLDAIDGGIYSLTDQGYLTIPEPGAYALIFGALGLGLSIVRRRR